MSTRTHANVRTITTDTDWQTSYGLNAESFRQSRRHAMRTHAVHARILTREAEKQSFPAFDSAAVGRVAAMMTRDAIRAYHASVNFTAAYVLGMEPSCESCQIIAMNRHGRSYDEQRKMWCTKHDNRENMPR